MAEVISPPALSELSTQDVGLLIGGLLTEEAKASPPKGPDGKFISPKAKEPERGDAPLPITAADGTPDEGAEPPADEKVEGKSEKEPAKEEEEERGEDESAEEKPAPRLVKVKADGIEIEVDEEELKKGYSRTKDYTQKTQALAEERRRFKEEQEAPVRAERQLYADRLEALHTAVVSLLPETEPDWNEVRNRSTPEEFTEAFAQWRGQQQRVEKIRAEQARVAALQQADADRMWQARLVAEHEQLKAALPDMADVVKGKALKDDLIAYAKSLKFSDDDLAQVTDHRVLVLLDKARRFDEAQLRKPKIEDKIDRALETIKPSGTRPKSRVTEMERAKGRLAETGRIDDAAALINQML